MLVCGVTFASRLGLEYLGLPIVQTCGSLLCITRGRGQPGIVSSGRDEPRFREEGATRRTHRWRAQKPHVSVGRQGCRALEMLTVLKIYSYRVAETVACWPFPQSRQRNLCRCNHFCYRPFGLLCCIRSQQTGGRCSSYELGKSEPSSSSSTYRA
ncbi:hypothetical protein TNCT_376161, partial [Trichonephila clavata]